MRRILAASIVMLCLAACGGDPPTAAGTETGATGTVSTSTSARAPTLDIETVDTWDGRFTLQCGDASPAIWHNAFPPPSGGPVDIGPLAQIEFAAAGPDGARVLVVDGGSPGKFTSVGGSQPRQQTISVVSKDGKPLRVSTVQWVDGGWTLIDTQHC